MILLVTDIKRVASIYAKRVERELSFVKLIKHLKVSPINPKEPHPSQS